MALTYVAVVSAALSGTPGDMASSLNVAAGDLLIALWGCYNDPGAVSIADTDGSTNSFTMLTTANSGALYTGIGYVLSATADATATFRLTFGTSRGYTGFIVYQFRPDAGETVSLDTSGASAAGSSTTPQSANFTTTGDDEVAVATLYLSNGKTWNDNREIGDVACDGYTDPRIEHHGWYKIFAATQSGIHAQANMGASDTWLIDVASFKSAAAAGGGSTGPQKMMHLARQRRR